MWALEIIAPFAKIYYLSNIQITTLAAISIVKKIRLLTYQQIQKP